MAIQEGFPEVATLILDGQEFPQAQGCLPLNAPSANPPQDLYACSSLCLISNKPPLANTSPYFIPFMTSLPPFVFACLVHVSPRMTYELQEGRDFVLCCIPSTSDVLGHQLVGKMNELMGLQGGGFRALFPRGTRMTNVLCEGCREEGEGSLLGGGDGRRQKVRGRNEQRFPESLGPQVVIFFH